MPIRTQNSYNPRRLANTSARVVDTARDTTRVAPAGVPRLGVDLARVHVGDDAEITPAPGLRSLQGATKGSVIQRQEHADRAEAPARAVEASRAEKLAAYNQALDASDWPEAAKRLNGFNDKDIITLVKKLSNTQFTLMRQGASESMPGYAERVLGFLEKYGPVQTEGDDASLAGSQQIELKGLKGLDRQMAEIYNEKGAYLQQIAQSLGIDVAIAAAVLKVESGGDGFGPSGRMIIRFENHVFYRHWGKQNKPTFTAHFRFTSWQGNTHFFRDVDTNPWRQFHNNQSTEWEVFEYARGLEEEAAVKSISMGAGQIMGGNYQKLGYSSAREMFDHMSGGVRPQLDDMFTFIKRNPRCLQALKNNDYALFARYYNGGGQVAAYASKLNNAADAFRRVRPLQINFPMTNE